MRIETEEYKEEVQKEYEEAQEELKQELEEEQNKKKKRKTNPKIEAFKKKLDFFWTYDKWCVIIPFIIIVISVSLISGFIEDHKDASLYIAFTNSSEILDAEDAIRTEYVEFRNINKKKNPINIADNIYYPVDAEDQGYSDQSILAGIQKYSVLITNGRADITFSNTWVFEAYELESCYMDLREAFGEEFVEENKDLIFYAVNKEGESVPIAIDVVNWSKLGRFYDMADPYVAIASNTTNYEESVEFIKWVLEQD